MAMTSSWRPAKLAHGRARPPRFTAVTETLATLREVVLMPRDLLPKLGHDCSGIELADFAPKRVPEGLRRLHQFLELDAFFWPERGLTEKVVV